MLDEIVRDGARAMLAAALQAEVAAYINAHAGQVDESGYRLVVRNGYHQPREVATAAGAVPVRAPRVNDRRADRKNTRGEWAGDSDPAGRAEPGDVVPVWVLGSGGGFEGDPVAHGGELGDVVADLSFGGDAVGVVVGAEVVEAGGGVGE